MVKTKSSSKGSKAASGTRIAMRTVADGPVGPVLVTSVRDHAVGDDPVVPTLLREEEPVEPHHVFLPLTKLAKMINEGSIKLAASPRDQLAAKKLKGLTQELHGHGLHIDIDLRKLKK